MEKETAKVFINTAMGISLRESGKMIKSKLENIISVLVINFKEDLNKGKCHLG